ncbi:MAG: DUF3224 domain-containing protein [Acidobacteriota bacterium]
MKLAGTLLAFLLLTAPVVAMTKAEGMTTEKEGSAMMHARGTFEVKVLPQSADEIAGVTTLGRMSLDKKLAGDLEGTGKGEMLTAMSPVQGSAGYVAVERISGTLGGRKGTFALQHSGTMTRGVPHLVITVVPDSGTGELTGLTGTMTIDIAADGTHSYDLEYTLPAEK